MSVIGRLDGQVEEVIIKPISERRRDEEPPAPTPGPEEPAPQNTPEGETTNDREGLPVWLL